MADLTAIIERVDKLLLRHEELKRTNQLLQGQLDALTIERDALRSRLQTARTRLDALLERLPGSDSAGRSTPA
jgi:cell division protein ZapB